MKITGIDIGEYRQFKNIKFDFTYPKGHPKEGKPLEKVCFIGQSGTGKTTLLNVIEEYFKTIDFGLNTKKFIADKVERKNQRHRDDTGVAFYNYIQDIRISAVLNDNVIVFDRLGNSRASERGGAALDLASSLDSTYNNQENSKFCLYIRESISREADAFLFDQKDHPQTFSDFIKTDTQVEIEKNARESRISQAGQKKVVSLGDMQSISIWQYLLREINEYDETTVARIKNLVQNTPKNKFQEELQKWLEADPRHELAEKCLNPILNKLFLELDTNAGDIPITLRTIGGVKIDSSYLSTGTRQMLATAIPLYKFDTTNTVILFDEPERSLFPDVLRILIGYYVSLAPEAQFFFATHSPIIASAFEPYERFILYFNEHGEVKCKNGIAPIGDDSNDLLHKDFNISPIVPDEGVEAYQNYLDLVTKIRNETEIGRKMELIAERSEIGNKYNFPATNSDETN